MATGSTKVIAVRHSECTWNREGREMGWKDSPLTDEGIAQAQALAARLQKIGFDALYSSDLGRAQATAQCIADKCNMEIETDIRLRERNMGIFQGLTIAEMRKKYADIRREYEQRNSSFIIPMGESADQRQQRSLECFEELAAKHIGQTIVIVTHGGVLGGILQHIIGMSHETNRSFRKPMAYASLNVFQHENGRWYLVTWNDTGHLGDLEIIDQMVH